MSNQAYPQVVEAGKSGNTVFLDLGCHSTSSTSGQPLDSNRFTVGTDVRRLVYNGYAAHNIFGCDLRDTYVRLGRKLYADEDTSPIRFFTSDIFDVTPALRESKLDLPLGEVSKLEQLRNGVDHLYTGALFHLFDEATQYAIAIRTAVLLTRKPGAVVFGRHQGLEEEGPIPDHLSRFVFHRLVQTLRLSSSFLLESDTATLRHRGRGCGGRCLKTS